MTGWVPGDIEEICHMVLGLPLSSEVLPADGKVLCDFNRLMQHHLISRSDKTSRRRLPSPAVLNQT